MKLNPRLFYPDFVAPAPPPPAPPVSAALDRRAAELSSPGVFFEKGFLAGVDGTLFV